MTWIERLLARLGYVPVERVDEVERALGLEQAALDRVQNRCGALEDALVLERSKPQLTPTEQVAVIGAHLSAVRAQADRLVAAHG